MLWTVGSLSLVVGVYLGAIYGLRARKANQGTWVWGIGAAVVYLAIMGILMWLTDLVTSAAGMTYYWKVWIAAVLWFIVTLVSGSKTDSVFEKKLPAA